MADEQKDGAKAPGSEGSAAPGGADAGKTETPEPGGEGVAASDTKTEENSALLTGEAEAKDTGADIELKLPEGVLADTVAQKDFKSLAKELGLKSDGAQKLVDFSAKVQASNEKQARESYAKTMKGWQDAAKTDKEYGGQSFQENLKTANRAVEKFGGKALAKVLQESGLGNHPDVIRAFYRAGKAMSEDTIRGTQAENGGVREGEQPKDPWTKLYEGKMGPPGP